MILQYHKTLQLSMMSTMLSQCYGGREEPSHPSVLRGLPPLRSFILPSVLTFFHTSVYLMRMRAAFLGMSRSTFLLLRNSSAPPPGSWEELIKLYFFEYRLIIPYSRMYLRE